MTTFYECVFAPVASTRREVIQNAQVVQTNGRMHYEALHPDAFRGWGKEDIPILIDHDEARVAGKVVAVASHRDWMLGSFVLDGPYAEEARRCIERSGRLSPCFESLEKDPDFALPFSPHHYPYHWHLRAKLNEISVLSTGSLAWYEGAKVTRTQTYNPKPPTSTPAGEVFYGGPVIRRVFTPPKIVVR